VALGLLHVGEAEGDGQVVPHVGSDPVRGPPVQGVQGVADVEQPVPGTLEVAVRHVDQPGGDERVEDRRVPESSAGVPQVRHRCVGELAQVLHPPLHELPQGGQLGLGVTAPLREHRGPEAEGHGRVPRDVPGVEHPEGDADVLLRRGRDLRQVPHRVVDRGAGVPQRVPEGTGHLRDAGAVLGVHQHDVEVAVRRELAAAVATDRDQGKACRRAVLGTTGERPRERCRAQGVGSVRAGPPVGRGHA
jgi:hypothetical protein